MKAIASLACLVVIALPAVATQQRSFVSSTGSDANNCTRLSPCRNFAAAITQTNDGGEVVALDSAGYGAVTVAKPVTIVAPGGVYAAISVFTGAGISINTTAGSVVLRNLNVVGQGGSGGIDAVSAKWLTVDHCTISGFPSDAGIHFVASNQGPVGMRLIVVDTTVRDSSMGIWVDGDASLVDIAVDSSRFQNGTVGFLTDAGRTMIRNSLASGNSQYGFYARCLVAQVGTCSMNLENSAATNNGSGVSVDSGVLTFHGGSVTKNNVGFQTYADFVSPDLLITDADISLNDIGIVAGPSNITVTDSSLLGNNSAVVGQGGTLRLKRNSFTRNVVNGFTCPQATVIHSSGDNVLEGNGTDNDGCAFGTLNEI